MKTKAEVIKGKACKVCGGVLRYKNSGKCIACHEVRNAARNRGKAKTGEATKKAVAPINGDNGALVRLYNGVGQWPAALNEIAGGIKHHLECAKTHLEKTVSHIETVCGELEKARPLCTEMGFSAFCKQVGIGRSRAYELLAIADGRKTIEQVRAEGRERSKRFYAQLRRPLETDKPKAEIIKPEPPIIEGEIIKETPPIEVTPTIVTEPEPTTGVIIDAADDEPELARKIVSVIGRGRVALLIEELKKAIAASEAA
jgi:hypothetical protein